MHKSSYRPKIICIGWHKTGTSTVGDALLMLKYNVVGARLDLAHSLLAGDKDPAIELAKQFNALQDVPWAALFKELDEAFPGSKFIYTDRADDAWLNSASKHFKDNDIPLHEWLYGNGILKGNEELYLKRFQKHRSEVISHFKNRPDDLLVMNFANGDGWEKLCTFLDVDVPSRPFPHSNKGRHNYTLRDKITDRIRFIVPERLRIARVELLHKLGLHHGRNRFNNAVQNRRECQN